MSKRVVALAVVILAVCGATVWLSKARPWESSTERAHRLCGECGFGPHEIEQLIDDVRHSTSMREENLELFYATFQRRADEELYHF